MKLIAVLAGGFSHEKVVSVKSAATIIKYIDKSKYTPVLVLVEKEKWTAEFENSTYVVDKNDFSITVNSHKIKFEGAFNIIHGTPGEDGLISGYFDMLGIQHTSNKALQGSLTFDKFLCNKLAKSFGAVTANSFLLTSMNDPQIASIEKEIGFPCFVKPNDSGSSFGVTKVKQASELDAAIKHAFDNGTAVVVEAFVNGTEVACGIVKLKGKITVLPITEIVPDTEFFDFTAKYEGKSKEITPARISEKAWKQVQHSTQLLYEKFMLRSFARIDFIIQNDVPYLIEMNTIPGMSEASLVPQQVREYGWTLEHFVTSVADEFFE
ncbi:MAG TPA: D-alanine--D-alanine ligase [Flavobacteriales bacterium]|nr:D-alanine--D-alanine ligase [Flavobacteriales bacterium]